ncbi:MAG TPA: hypothetical protein VGH79_10250 [Gaiellaceae bacterium]
MFSVLSLTGELSPLERWGAISAIVAGVIALILFVIAACRFISDYVRRPRLEIAAGQTDKLAHTRPDLQFLASEGEVAAAYATFLTVDAKPGKRLARDVSVRLTPPHFLLWRHNVDKRTDIRAGDSCEAIVQLVVVHTDGTGRVPFSLQTPGRTTREFEAEVLIGDKTHTRKRFRIENGWHADSPGLPNPYPTIVEDPR